MKILFSLYIIMFPILSSCQDKGDNKNEVMLDKIWTLHFQQTLVTQFHGNFYAKYSGDNSFKTDNETKTSITATLFAGINLWRGASVYVNPELAGGNGLSGVTGIAGFPNGEIYRIDSPEPKVTIGRLFLKQVFSFGNKKEHVEDDVNQIEGKQSSNRLTVVLGRFSVADYFDGNSYSHDARTLFLNWALMDNGAWDYAADTKGYTIGIMTEYRKMGWSIRFAAVLVPKIANGIALDTRIKDAHSLNVEFGNDFRLFKRKSAISFFYYNNLAQMGNYRQATDDTTYHHDITLTRTYSRSKSGFGLSFEHEINKNLGTFLRFSWNDGKNETWAFTEIDRSLSLGFLLKGSVWKRENDNFGIAFVANGLSQDHRDYLASGGYGFIIGDGKLNYSNEIILESFYSFQIVNFFTLSGDYQLIVNPAYNKDRGPVHIFSIRSHIEI